MLDGTVMGDAIAEAIMDAGASAEGKAMCKEFWEKVGKAIVEHITTNAQVNSGFRLVQLEHNQRKQVPLQGRGQYREQGKFSGRCFNSFY